MEIECPKVYVLLDGYCNGANADGWAKACGTVTLIVTPKKKILVDCGNPWNGDSIVDALSEYSFRCDDVTELIITHGHSDHCGNLSLFKGATIYMANDMARSGVFGTFKDNLRIDKNVEIWRTPGHTDHDLSVMVSNTEHGIVAITGDIFEHELDDTNWKTYSSYPEMQQKSRQLILGVADWIIPGHGRIFKNNLKST